MEFFTRLGSSLMILSFAVLVLYPLIFEILNKKTSDSVFEYALIFLLIGFFIVLVRVIYERRLENVSIEY